MQKIKICGITKIEDAFVAIESGAWAIGFVFFEKSPRFVTIENAKNIIQNISGKVKTVGVFVNKNFDEIKNIVEQTGIDIVQLHGEESSEYCKRISNEIGKVVIKAFRINNEKDLLNIASYKDNVFAVLLDSFHQSEYGGTGKPFNWELAVKAKEINIPIIIAGGINSDNIIEAKEKIAPYAFDLSSGVELSPGIKNHQEIKKLFNIIS